MIITKPSREINPHFEKVGRRIRLTGYIATLTDGVDVIFSREYSYYHEAEEGLDKAVYDLLANALADELSSNGLREANADESGWCFKLSNGSMVWVTDDV